MLILFEFLFGSVAYLRVEEKNVYSVTQNIVLITFSYLGNIMMANILIAFLTNQYTKISTNAGYVTKKMQYQILKAFNTKKMSCVFMTPLFLNFIYIIVGPFMIIKKVRKFVLEGHLNHIMNIISHIIVIAIPMTITTSALLLCMVVVHYFRLVFRFFTLLFIINQKGEAKSQFGDRLVTFLTFFFFGIFILLVLWYRDVKMLVIVLFDFEVAEIDKKFWNKTYSDDEKKMYIRCLKDFLGICEKFKKKNTKYVKISEILYTFRNDPKMQNFGKGNNIDDSTLHNNKLDDMTIEL